jgi:hypothetical protein
MIVRAALAAIAAGFWSPATSGELKHFTITVLEEVRHEVTIQAESEDAARTIALMEARRTAGSSHPAWGPPPPSVISHVHKANDFSVVAITPSNSCPGVMGGAWSFANMGVAAQ